MSAAFLCEKVLSETDGVKSAIRIIDRVTRTVFDPTPPETMAPFDYSVTLFVRFKSGAARGPMNLEVRFSKPSMESPSPFRQTVNFEGEEDRGVDIVGQIRIRFDQPGLHWFDVNLDGVRLTRIPLRVIYIPQITQTSEPRGGPPQP